MRPRLRILLAAVIGVFAVLATIPLTRAEAALNLLPMNVTNNSGRSGPVYLYLLGVNLNTGRLGYVNAAGTFTPWPAGSLPPSPAPDVSIPGPADGASRTIQIPLNLSGRMYMAFGEKLKFFLTPDGLVQPAPQNPSDPNRNILFDWSEFTYNTGGLWLNSSQVDMFAVPHTVGVTGSTGQTTRTGTPVADGRNKIFNTIAGLPGWGGLINTRADGTLLRVLSPRLGIETGAFSATYLDGYINQVWAKYQSTTLTVAPFREQPDLKYFGRVSGTTMNFTNAAGAQVASFPKPLTKDVFGCDGRLAAPNDQVVGPIARSLCAAFHRSTLGFINTAPTYDASQFYVNTPTDSYAKTMHANMVDGRAYGFAFDDVGNFESLVHDGDPRSASVTIAPFGSGPPPPPPPPPGGGPKRYLLAGGGLGDAAATSGAAPIASAAGANHDGTPVNPQVFTASAVNLTYQGGTATFDLFVDSASAGNGTQVRISYDLTGNGTYDRIETYQYFATDPVPGYEHYTQAWRGGLLSSSGALGNLANGRVRVEVWNAIGGGASTLGIGDQSVVSLPFS